MAEYKLTASLLSMKLQELPPDIRPFVVILQSAQSNPWIPYLTVFLLLLLFLIFILLAFIFVVQRRLSQRKRKELTDASDDYRLRPVGSPIFKQINYINEKNEYKEYLMLAIPMPNGKDYVNFCRPEELLGEKGDPQTFASDLSTKSCSERTKKEEATDGTDYKKPLEGMDGSDALQTPVEEDTVGKIRERLPSEREDEKKLQVE